MNGFEVCVRIRQDPKFQYVNIIMVSAMNTKTDYMSGYEVGANDYVTKPFDKDILLKKIETYLELKSVKEMMALQGHAIKVQAHQIRTHLSSVITASEMFTLRLQADDDKKQMANMILEQAEILLQTSDDTSMLVRLHEGIFVEDSDGYFDTVMLKNRLENDLKGVEVIRKEKFYLKGDFDLLHRSLKALAKFGLEHATKKTTPMIDIRREDKLGIFQLRYEGNNIPTKKQEKIFYPFMDSMLNDPNDFWNRGNFLGLCIAAQVAKNYGGTLDIKNEGTVNTLTFSFAL